MRHFVGITLAALVLATASCGGEEKAEVKDEKDTSAKVKARENTGLKIAYYVQDSLQSNFKYYQHEDSTITKKQMAFQNELQRRNNELQNYVSNNESKAASGLLSQVEIQQIQMAVQQKQEALMAFQQSEGAKIEQETMAKLEVIGNKIDQFSNDYCEEDNIDLLLIYAKGGQVGFIHESMDVTMEFMEFLNQKQDELENDIKK